MQPRSAPRRAASREALDLAPDASLRAALAALERLEMVVAQSPVPMATLSGLEPAFESANAAYQRLAGGRTLVGKPAVEAWPDLAGHGFLDLVDQVRGTRKAASAREVPIRSGDGAVANNDFVYQPLLGASGEVVGILALAYDVTEAVRDRLLLRGVLDQMPSGLIVREAKTGRILVENQSLRRIADRGLHDGFDVFTSGGRKYGIDEFPLRRTLSTGEVVEGEQVVYATRDGIRKHLALSSAPLRDAQGEMSAAIGIVQDLTAQSEAEDALRETDEILRLLVDNVPQIIWSGWNGSRVGYYSRYTERYTGVPIERIKAEGFRILLHPAELPAVQARWQDAQERTVPFEMELRVRRHDGQYRWHLARAMPVHVDDRPVRWFGTLTDIQDQKHQEQEASRLADLNQQLLGIVGHDLRDPISAVLFSAAQLRMGHVSDVQRKQAARISSSAERALRILETLLDFTRAQIGGGIPLSREQVDVGELCRELCDDLSDTGGRALELSLEGDLRAELDPVRLSQVVSNLVSNAIQYGAANAPVSVRARGTPCGIEIAVHNEGAPIPEEEIPVLFEAYKRRSSLRERGRNLGLGLYIVRQIAQAHGGEVEVRSNAEEGTTFAVRLPR